MARRYDDDDDANPYDANGILKDGRSVTVPMMMRDAMRRDIARNAASLDDGRMFDASLRRPGFRHADSRTLDATERAYSDYENAQTNAWRGADAEGGVEGALCTVKNAEYPEAFGSRGHLVRVGNKLVCTPDRRDDARRDALPVRDEREQTYAAYQSYAENAWRSR
jgi:hypothetical protein